MHGFCMSGKTKNAVTFIPKDKYDDDEISVYLVRPIPIFNRRHYGRTDSPNTPDKKLGEGD